MCQSTFDLYRCIYHNNTDCDLVVEWGKICAPCRQSSRFGIDVCEHARRERITNHPTCTQHGPTANPASQQERNQKTTPLFENRALFALRDKLHWGHIFPIVNLNPTPDSWQSWEGEETNLQLYVGAGGAGAGAGAGPARGRQDSPEPNKALFDMGRKKDDINYVKAARERLGMSESAHYEIIRRKRKNINKDRSDVFLSQFCLVVASLLFEEWNMYLCINFTQTPVRCIAFFNVYTTECSVQLFSRPRPQHFSC
jgi:hypothetical protein